MPTVVIAGTTSGQTTGIPSTRNQLNILVSPPAKIPEGAKNVQAYLRSFRCPYSFVNINASNNKFFFTDNLGLPTKYALTLDSGLYGLDNLNESLQLKLQEAITASGFPFTNTDFSYVGDTATGKTILTITASGYQVNHSTGSFFNLTGFTENRRTPSGALTTSTAGTYFYSNNVAQFQNITDIVVQTSLPVAYNFNGRQLSALGIIPINVGPNSTIIYPNDIPEFEKLDVPLAGANISSLQVTLLDGQLNTLDLNGRDFSVEVCISYDL